MGSPTTLDTLIRDFEAMSGHRPMGVWRAPGRVNLIGEHTDYNEGFVLPFAIANAVHVAVALRSDRELRAVSSDFGRAGHDLEDEARATGWLRYPEAAIRALEATGIPVPGVEIAIESTVPTGAGLSSSAALLCATLIAITDLVGSPRSGEEIASLAQRAETDWVGVPVGAMDPLASMCGSEGNVLFIDCRSLEHQSIGLRSSPGVGALRILVIDVRAHRQLVGGEYAKRRRSCEKAAAELGVRSLRDATLEILESHPLRQPEASRARHVITENERVLETVALLRQGRLESIGSLLDASHRSLAMDYEVSIPHLDVAVAAAVAGGALGARMTGAGFGGCAIALVAEDLIDQVTSSVTAAFDEHGFGAPEFLNVWPSAGASRVS